MPQIHLVDNSDANAGTARPVDLSLAPHEAEFLLAQTGLTDVKELETHILQVQSEATEVFPYPCIRRFDFIKLKISNLPAYEKFLRLGKERARALFLDIGCCFGTDIRKAVADGYPVDNIIASDLRPDFWTLGHRLFNTTPETFPVAFVGGDVLDSSFISPCDVLYDEAPELNVKSLHDLHSLIPLQGNLSAIHASNFFHLFSEADQLILAQRLASLLSPQAGSMIFGTHVSRTEKGFRSEAPPAAPGYLGDQMFCHSPQSWTEMWDREVFRKGTVKVEAKVVEQLREDLVVLEPGVKFYKLIWSVIRI